MKETREPDKGDRALLLVLVALAVLEFLGFTAVVTHWALRP
jgi:hypothetical protein